MDNALLLLSVLTWLIIIANIIDIVIRIALPPPNTRTHTHHGEEGGWRQASEAWPFLEAFRTRGEEKVDLS